MTRAICFLLFLQTQQQTPDPFASKIDLYVKVVGGIVALLGFLFGLPITIQQLKKTRAEIRKLELEAKKLEAEAIPANAILTGEGHRISIDGHDNSVTILTDPRFLAPLLLLLSFIIAIIVLILAEYASSFLMLLLPYLFSTLNENLEPLRKIFLVVIAIVLLFPIFREALRVRQELEGKEEKD